MSLMGRVGIQDSQENDLNRPPTSEAFTANKENEKSNPHAILGNTIIIRGELCGEEDLTIEGRVEGQINLKSHHLVVGQAGNVSADVIAKSITIVGRVEGNLKAEERVEIKKSGTVTGDVRSPRVVIEDGAKFKGSIDMNSEANPVDNNKVPAFDGKAQNRKTEAKQVDLENVLVPAESK